MLATAQGKPGLHLPDFLVPSLRMARSIDPVKFAQACGFNPDPWQAHFLRSTQPRRMLNCTRQGGKSTTVAAGALHRAVYTAGALVLLLSKAERQSAELMRKVQSLKAHAPDLPRVLSEGTLQLELANGSRIIALPGKEETVRGFSAVNLLVVDEASRVADELFFAIQPMLAVSKGEMWTLSSPFGTRGWWYAQWKQMKVDRKMGRKPIWEYYEVPATMVDRISPEFLEQERRNMGEWWFRQEYCCEFMDAQAAAFGSAEVDRAFEEDITPWLV